MSLISAPQISYKQDALSHPTYKFNQVLPNTFGQAIALGSGQIPIQISIPAEVFNWAGSYLYFTINIPGVAGNYIWTREDTWSAISHIQHYGPNNQYIADLDNFQNYMNIVQKKETSLDDFQSLDPSNRFYPSNSLNNVVPALRYSAAPGTPNPSSVNYLEPAAWAVGGLGQGVTINCMLPMRMIKNSIFCVDKDLYYGQVSFLRLYFGMLSKVGFMSTSNTDPNLGNPTAITSNCTITNLQLYLQVEANTDMRAAIMSKVQNSGMELLIPFVQTFKNSNQGPTQNVNVPLDAGSGQTLLKIIHSVYNQNEQLNTAYDCSNNPTGPVPQKVLLYRTLFNNKPLQDITLDASLATGQYTDYLQNKHFLKNSVIQNQNMYQYNWFHCDDFSGFGPEYDQSNNTDLISGQRMAAVPLVWTFQGQNMTNAQYIHYTYCVMLKKFTMTPQLLSVV